MIALSKNIYIYAQKSLIALRFYSRIPIPLLPYEKKSEKEPHCPPNFDELTPVIPFTSFILGVFIASPMALAFSLGISPMISALFALIASLLITGAFHEDGLADMADGFGGGMSLERKLEIMKDSRLGTYGASALFCSLLMRLLIITQLLNNSGLVAACFALIAGAVLSRTLAIALACYLPPARQEGAAFAAGQPNKKTWLIAVIIAYCTCFLCLFDFFSISQIVLAFVISGIAIWAMAKLSMHQIKGQTGDVAGATQQISELCFLLILTLAL